MGAGLTGSWFIIYFAMHESDDYQEPSTDRLTAATDPVLAELWDNDDDSTYDDLPMDGE